MSIMRYEVQHFYFANGEVSWCVYDTIEHHIHTVSHGSEPFCTNLCAALNTVATASLKSEPAQQTSNKQSDTIDLLQRWVQLVDDLGLQQQISPYLMSETVAVINKRHLMKVGDTVNLKSGGPVMTIIWVYSGVSAVPLVQCEWFENTVIKKNDFPIYALEPAVPHDI